jgi:predicted transglutaminase-like cysteine proteinase
MGSAKPTDIPNAGRPTMSALARAAQILSLIGAVIFCHDASTDAHFNALSATIEAYGDETAYVQVAPDISSEKKSEPRFSPELALLAPRTNGQSAEYTSIHAEPFGLPTMATSPSDVSSKWARLQSRLLSEERTLAVCRADESACPAAARRLLSIIELGRQSTGRALLGRINRAVNLSVRRMSDWAQYGVADYWATPLETLNNGAGDCEDYAIVKYVALRESGITPEDLRLLIVRNIRRQTDHAVVAARYKEKWLILDNQTLVMVNADLAQYYYPLFVLDQRGVRKFVTAVASR